MHEKAARDVLYQRSRGLCEICGMREATNVQHRKNRSQGGTWEPSNLLHLCGSGTTGCHGRIHANPRHAYRTGWSVHAWENPAETPVFVWHSGVVCLDDAGSYTRQKPWHSSENATLFRSAWQRGRDESEG